MKQHCFQLATIAALLFAGVASATSITNLTEWTLIEDPQDPGMSAMIDSPSQATLTATGSINPGVDIGYGTIDGMDVATSTSGFYFSPNEDFTVAIDYDISSLMSMGLGGIGLGIGEDVLGTDSAGIGIALQDGMWLAAAGAARDGNMDAGTEILLTTPALSGRLFVEYNSITGSVILGINSIQGSNVPGATATLNGVQNLWDDQGLLASFFLRSEGAFNLTGLSSGTLTAVFSNFEVLEGTPIVIPEPSAAMLALLAASGASLRRAGGRRRALS